MRSSPIVVAARLPLALLLALAGATLAERTAAAGPAVAPTFEASGAGSWRVSIDVMDRAPGLEILSGGGEVFVGAAFNWIGVVAGGRVRAGSAPIGTFVEAGGDLALQALLGERVRLKLGGEVGRAWLSDANSWFAGGFLEGLFDVAQFGGGRWALTFNLRIDFDTYLTADIRFPDFSTAVGVGFGFRY